MVMDETQQQQPSPQSVGREFVRQYYTLLNKAPNHLHRFYNNHSSFIHGESTLVVGQKNIYTRIQQLKFHDCHAKISQVDAQATLGNGVVVQVTGELSNDGQPMRRFTQTFVLAAQSPKKYYVHNDIFRYQDMYADEENDVESRSEHDEELEQPGMLNNAEPMGLAEQQQAQPTALQQQPQAQQQPVVQLAAASVANAATVIAQPTAATMPQQQQQAAQVMPTQQPIYYSIPAAAAGARPLHMHQGPPAALPGAAANAAPYGATAVPLQAGASLTQLNGVVAHEEVILTQQQQPLVATAVSGAVTVLTAQNAAIPIANAAAMPQNNAAAAGQLTGFQQSPVLPPVQQQTTTMLAQQPPPVHHHLQQHTTTVAVSAAQADNLVESHSAYNVESNIIVDDFKTINEQQQQEKYEAAKQQQLQNEPKTYANLLKTTTSSPSGFVNAAMQQQQQYQQQQQHQQQQQQQQQQHQQHHVQQHNHNSSSNSNNSNNGNASSSTSSLYQTQNNISTSTYTQSTNNGNNMYNNRNNDNGSMHHRLDNNAGNNMLGGHTSLPPRQNPRINKGFGYTDFDQRRSSNTFSDNQQLFLGNIPLNASEDELRKFFQKFGNVMELRVLSKPIGKLLPGGRNPANYGFITYDDIESVQNCLSHIPLYFPENSADAQKLNVEEKKPRTRSDLPPRPSMSNNMSNMNNNPRNMPGGPQSRSLSSGGGSIMRGNNAGNMGGGGGGGNMSRGANTGGRVGTSYNRSGAANGGSSQLRGGNNNNNNNNNVQSGGGSYGNRR